MFFNGSHGLVRPVFEQEYGRETTAETFHIWSSPLRFRHYGGRDDQSNWLLYSWQPRRLISALVAFVFSLRAYCTVFSCERALIHRTDCALLRQFFVVRHILKTRDKDVSFMGIGCFWALRHANT
jgi:hypothetical protein